MHWFLISVAIKKKKKLPTLFFPNLHHWWALYRCSPISTTVQTCFLPVSHPLSSSLSGLEKNQKIISLLNLRESSLSPWTFSTLYPPLQNTINALGGPCKGRYGKEEGGGGNLVHVAKVVAERPWLIRLTAKTASLGGWSWCRSSERANRCWSRSWG